MWMMHLHVNKKSNYDEQKEAIIKVYELAGPYLGVRKNAHANNSMPQVQGFNLQNLIFGRKIATNSYNCL